MIKEFRREFSFLSNFYPCKIKYGDLEFGSVECAFQALKSTDKGVRRMFVGLEPAAAKRFGRRIVLRDDWNAIKVNVMEYLLRLKFKDETLKKALLATGDLELVEGNWWNDRFWGVDLKSNIGENMLGKLLMKIRADIRNERK